MEAANATETVQSVVDELAPKYKQASGSLSWYGGDAMKFLGEFFQVFGFPMPKVPAAVFLTMYNEVKSASGRFNQEALTREEMNEFAQRAAQFALINLRGEMRVQRRRSVREGTFQSRPLCEQRRSIALSSGVVFEAEASPEGEDRFAVRHRKEKHDKRIVA